MSIDPEPLGQHLPLAALYRQQRSWFLVSGTWSRPQTQSFPIPYVDLALFPKRSDHELRKVELKVQLTHYIDGETESEMGEGTCLRAGRANQV